MRADFGWRRSRDQPIRTPAERDRGDGDVGGHWRADTQTELSRLFLNLLINAAQALSPGGAALVDAERHTGTIEVTIADTGAPRYIASNRHGEPHVANALGHGTTVPVTSPARA